MRDRGELKSGITHYNGFDVIDDVVHMDRVEVAPSVHIQGTKGQFKTGQVTHLKKFSKTLASIGICNQPFTLLYIPDYNMPGRGKIFVA